MNYARFSRVEPRQTTKATPSAIAVKPNASHTGITLSLMPGPLLVFGD